MSGFYFMVGIVCFAVVGLVIAYHVIKSAVRNGIKESGLINVKTTYEELRTLEPSYVELRKGIVESNPDKPDGEIDRLTRNEAEDIIRKKRASRTLLAFTVSDCLARASSCHMVYRPDRLLALTVMVGPFLSSLEYEFGRFCRFRNAITNACVMALVMPQTKN